MSESPRTSGPQFRADRAMEQEAVRTTIVGGRPPGSGQSVGDIPRGIEILVKKAAVDPDFKELLLSKRADAADEIGLELDPAEAMMLRAAPAEQLGAVIDRTVVLREHRRVFLGKAAAAMLAALGLVQAGCDEPAPPAPTTGSRPDYPATTGIEPDMPEPNTPTVDFSTEDAAEPNQAGEEPSTDQPADSPPDQTIRGIRPDKPRGEAGSHPETPEPRGETAEPPP